MSRTISFRAPLYVGLARMPVRALTIELVIVDGRLVDVCAVDRTRRGASIADTFASVLAFAGIEIGRKITDQPEALQALYRDAVALLPKSSLEPVAAIMGACPECSGARFVIGKPCGTCDGSGVPRARAS